MTTYNTGNPIGSTDPKDLYDNAQNLDALVNSTTELSHADRMAVQRKTWHGMEVEFAQFLADSAYQDLGVYGAGIEVTRYNQVFLKDGEFYRASASLGLPYTTTGVWASESGSFVGVGDAVLRQDLDAPGGSGLVGYDGGTAQDVLDEAKPMANYTALRAYTGRATGVRITQAGLAGFFQRDDADTTSADNGGAIIVDAVGRRWKRLFVGYVNVKWFGAIGNGVADDYASINAALTYLKSLGGGTLEFPQGTYKVTDQIVIDSPCIRFVGTGRRKVYPGVIVPSSDTVSTILPVHSKRSAIRFYSATINTASTFSAEGINLATLETGAMPLVGFGWDGSGSFHRDYTFIRVGVHGFTSAFETYGAGGIGSFGLLKITDCSINRNNYIIRNLDGTAWNGFVFEKNEAGQNITGGISVRAQSCSIKNNALEGQPDAIKVFGNYNGVVISGNYFEANMGAYCVWLQETLNAYVGNNFWLNINSTEALKLENDIGTTVDDRIIPTCYGSVDLRSKEHAINPVPQGFGSAALIIDGSMITNVLNGYYEFGDYKVTSADGPLYGIPDSAGGLFTTSGTGLTQATKLGLSIPSGTYIGVAFAISYDDMPVLPPTFALRVNSQAGQGYHAPIFYGLDKVTQKVKGKTVLYYGVVKALADVSSFQLYIYPFGINPAAGLKCYLSAYAMYDLGTTLPSVSQVGSYAVAEIPAMHVQRVTAAPTVGTWPVGYKLNARSPAAGGFEGWICTTGGTPGTWKTFGAISA